MDQTLSHEEGPEARPRRSRRAQRRRDPVLITTLLVAFALACGAGDDGKRASNADPAQNNDDGSPAADFQWPDGPRPTVTLQLAGREDIVVELYPEIAPKTVENFVRLANEGFYDGTTFHRVIPGFMIQGGDPNSRNKDPSDDGKGGPGYKLEDEFNRAPHVRGTLSMASSGTPNSAGSQFFIVHNDSRHLDGHYTAFGRVRAGMDVVDEITDVETDIHGRWGARNRPIENIVIERAVVSEASNTADTASGADTTPRAAGPPAGGRSTNGAGEQHEDDAGQS